MKVFHHNDIDGHASAAIIYRQACNACDDNRADFIECNYASSLMPVIESIQPGEPVYIVDYSFSPATLHELQGIITRAGTNHVTWIDHHLSSMYLQEQYPELKSIPGIRRLGISGAALTHMYLYHCEYSELSLVLRHISDYDCWIKSMPYTDAIYYGLLSHDWNYRSTLWADVLSQDKATATLKAEGEAILRFLHHENQLTCKKWAFETQLHGNRCLAINRKVTSEVFGSDLSHYPLYCVFQFDGHQWRYSIYSQEINCSLLAAQYGGSGHKAAAGFTHPTCLFSNPSF